MPFQFTCSFQEAAHSLMPFQFTCSFQEAEMVWCHFTSAIASRKESTPWCRSSLDVVYWNHFIYSMWCPCGGALSTQKLKTFCWESRAIKGSFFNAGVAQNIASCASPTARNSVFLISALPVHSDSFLPNLLWKMLVLGQNRWIDIIVFLSVYTVNQIRLVILWTVFELY